MLLWILQPTDGTDKSRSGLAGSLTIQSRQSTSSGRGSVLMRNNNRIILNIQRPVEAPGDL